MGDLLELHHRLIDEVFNRGNYDVLAELVSPQMLEHQFETPERPGRVAGPDGVAFIAQILRAGSSDFHLEVVDAAVDGDIVWGRHWASGTDDGGQLGFPATGRTFGIPVVDITRWQAGKMVEHWGVPDRLNLLQQLGHVPAPPTGAPMTTGG